MKIKQKASRYITCLFFNLFDILCEYNIVLKTAWGSLSLLDL